MRTKVRIVALGFATALLCLSALGDTLELRSGQIYQGRFLGGSPLNIRFEVDGKELIVATKDVLNISFTDTSADSAPPAAIPGPAAGASTSPPPVTSAANSSAAQNSGAAPTEGIKIPAGTSLFVRMIDSVDSSRNQVGDAFHASLEDPLVVGNTVVAGKGADVYGKLAQVKEAGHISGGSELRLELTGIRINGSIVPIDSTDYDVAGKGRGGQSAGRIGGGAVLGAVIGGIAGGGRGAAIGAGAGAGAGTAVQLATHGEQVRIPSETLLEFRLQQEVMAPLAASAN
jgi:hypothetical protein